MGAGQTEEDERKRIFLQQPRRPEVNVFPSPRASLSHPIHPLSNPQRSRHPIIPPGRRAVSSSALELRSCSDRTKTSGRDEERQGRIWKGARGEQEELRTTGHNSTCANPATDSCLCCERLEGPLSAGRMHSRDVPRKTAI